MKKKSLILFFTLIICAFFSFQASAQVQSGDIVLNINPQYPKANESVSATVSSYVTDLNNAMITWTLNSETRLSGMGKKDFSFTVNGTGFGTTVEVKIETATGFSINKSITINPTDVDMLWEGYDSYVPPFYKGKKNISSEGMIKIVAMPNPYSTQGFSYIWKQDGKNKPSSSGYGKNFYIFKNSYLEDSNVVEATVTDLLSNNVGIGKITIKPGLPKIIFYKKDQNLGTKWENALSSNFSINPDGETLVAEPYFFSTKDKNLSNLDLTWFLNGEQTQTPPVKNTMSLKLESGQHGTASIKIIVNNAKTLFQSLEKQINVNF